MMRSSTQMRFWESRSRSSFRFALKTDRNATWGIVENLLPVLAAILSEAQAVALLRAYEAQLDRDRWRIVLKQVASSGKQMIRAWIDERLAMMETSATDQS